MEITEHGLKKQTEDEFYDVNIVNDNTDIVEDHLGDSASHTTVAEKTRWNAKVNQSDVIESTAITESGKIMDGKTVAEEFGKINQSIDSLNSRASNCILEMPTKPTYSGLVVTAYAGTKVLIPDGRNADGTLKSIEVALTADKTITVAGGLNGLILMNGEGNLGYHFVGHVLEVESLSDLPTMVANTNTWLAYVRGENKIYRTIGSTTADWQLVELTIIGEYTKSPTEITSLTPYKPFRMADYNEVKKELSEVVDTKLSELDTKLSDLKTNFQAGCSKIASAITANGVSTASNASPTTMSTNIGNIRSGGTLDAAGNQLLVGYDAISQKGLRHGSMPNRGAWRATNNSTFAVTIPAGYHNGLGTVTTNSTMDILFNNVADSNSNIINFAKTYRWVVFTITAKGDSRVNVTVNGAYWIDSNYESTDSDDMRVITLHMEWTNQANSISFNHNTQNWNTRAFCYGII